MSAEKITQVEQKDTVIRYATLPPDAKIKRVVYGRDIISFKWQQKLRVNFIDPLGRKIIPGFLLKNGNSEVQVPFAYSGLDYVVYASKMKDEETEMKIEVTFYGE